MAPSLTFVFLEKIFLLHLLLMLFSLAIQSLPHQNPVRISKVSTFFFFFPEKR